MHPRSKADFDVLYKELEAWRLHETTRIKNSGLPATEIREALEDLLSKEVKLLQTIDRLKIQASASNKITTTKQVLEKMSGPKEIGAANAEIGTIEMHTPFTIRAKELAEYYHGLCLPNIPKPERIDLLLHVKYTVKEFDCDLTRDITDLIAREEDLLRRGRSDQSLDALRKRLANLFLQFVKTPQFNPEAATFVKVSIHHLTTSSPPHLTTSSHRI